jgi:ketosteroid isomerase-like protein
MRLVTLAAIVVLLSVTIGAAGQTPADEVEAALKGFQTAWDARDVDALGACLNDPLIGYFQPGQVFDRAATLELARTMPRQPIEVTHGDFEPEVYGDVAFALMPTHLKPAPEVGLLEFDGLTGAAALLRTDGVWRMVAGCNVWDAKAMEAWVPEAQRAQVRNLDQAAQAAFGEFQVRADDALAGGVIDWPKFAALFHPQAVVLGPTGDGGELQARLLKPDGKTPAEDVPEVSLAPTADRRLVMASGWGAIVQAYDVQASVNGGAPRPYRVIDIRCYIPDQNTWQYVFAAIVPKGE